MKTKHSTSKLVARCSRPVSPKRGAALMLAIFVMTVAGTLVVAMADTQMLRYAALRNTREWDEARYLAEAGLNHAFSELENDIDWRGGIPDTEFPVKSGHHYSATVRNGSDGTVIIQAIGKVGTFQRLLSATIKHGG